VNHSDASFADCRAGHLRLFERQGCTLTCTGARRTLPRYDRGKWVAQYALAGRTLSEWLKEPTWWMVEGTVRGVERRWTLLPVAHPSARGSRGGYEREIEVLRAMGA
jgi:hypothetical protein